MQSSAHDEAHAPPTQNGAAAGQAIAMPHAGHPSVTSDDPDASTRIAEFAGGTAPWLVAVRMVSEGVDIPRLRVGVYATTTTTELFFRQAVGRFVRWTPGVKDQKAYLFIPDEARLRTRAFQIADQRRHSLRRREQERFERDEAALDDLDTEQLSLFAALSAVATDDGGGEAGDSAHVAFDGDRLDDDLESSDDDDPSLFLDLAPPPPLAGAPRPKPPLSMAYSTALPAMLSPLAAPSDTWVVR